VTQDNLEGFWILAVLISLEQTQMKSDIDPSFQFIEVHLNSYLIDYIHPNEDPDSPSK